MSCNRLTRLLSDILDLSRIEAGKLQIQRAPFHVAAVLSEVVDLFRPSAAQNGLELRSSFDPRIPQTLLGDSIRLEQVLINFVGNAIKFTQSGHVEIEAFLLPRHSAQGSRVLFCVSDTGIGIPDNLLGELFSPFAQASTGYTRSHQGAGLGLSICKRLLLLMGGNISVFTEQGVGTQFCFSLEFQHPGTTGAAQPETISSALPDELAGRTLLLAEDDLVSGVATARLIEKLGLAVVHVCNGKEAFEACTTRHFDLVLMDVQMPVMDGVAATRAIRERGIDVPIIALTAYALDGDKEKFFCRWHG